MSIEEFINQRISEIISNAEFYGCDEGWCEVKTDTDIVIPVEFRYIKYSYICELITEYVGNLGSNWKLDEEDGLQGIAPADDNDLSDEDWYSGITLVLYKKNVDPVA